MPYILALILIDIIVLFLNYTPDTWLVGWDNVMPELNIGLNFRRALFALWQDYRGLGLVDGMAHTANLLHTAYIAILSLVFPSHMLRYVFIMLTHLMGGIGMYLLIGKLTSQKKAGFAGALFYMFNLGVIQMYFAPLEVFAMHFTALPFITLTLMNVLAKTTYKNSLIFFLTCFLMTPQSFVPTVFIAFCVLFGFIILNDIILCSHCEAQPDGRDEAISLKKGLPRFARNDIRKIGWIIALFFIANAFWLIPYAYSIKYAAPEIPATRINQYSSEEIFYRNKDYGDIADVLMFKGFMLSTPEVDVKTNEYIPFLNAWDTHSKTVLYTGVYTFILFIFAVGIYRAIYDRNRLLLPFGLSWLVALFFLANNTPGFELANTWVRQTFPLIGEAFRFPFTKFITLFAFCFAIFFGYGIGFFIRFIPKKFFGPWIVLTISSMLIFYLSYPVFGGQFFSSLLRVRIPDDYFQTIEYFKDIPPDKRIAILPAESFWNWEYRSWGHRGSGFLWYGIAQPMLIRPFDPWSTRNEQFYNEIHYAIQRRNKEMFDNVLKKYSIEYLVLDTSIVNTGKQKAIDYEKLMSFLGTSSIVRQVERYSDIVIYYVDIPPIVNDISILRNPPKLNPASTFFYEDIAFANHGSYITTSEDPEFIYPFMGLFTEKTQDDLAITVNIADEITIQPRNTLTATHSSYTLEVPASDIESFIPVSISVDDENLIFTTHYPTIAVGNNLYTLPTKAIAIPLSTVTSPTYIELTESGQRTKLNETLLLRSNHVNTIKAIEGSMSELLAVDTHLLLIDKYQAPVQFKPGDTMQVQISKIVSGESIEQPIAKRDLSIADNKYIPIDDTVIYVTSDQTNTEVVMWNADMPHDIGYVMDIVSSWNFGLPLTFYIDNPFEKRAELDTILSKKDNTVNTIILPPIDPYHRGYGIHFVAKTMGQTTSETVLHDFSAYPIPFNLLKNIRFVQQSEPQGKTIQTTPIESQRISPYKYRLTAIDTADNYIYLDQMYQEGWKALNDCTWLFIGCKPLEHVMVNNWANGWKLPENDDELQNVTIIFWPQYLEYIGLGMLSMTFLSFFILSFQKKNQEAIKQSVHSASQKTKYTFEKIGAKLKEEL